MQRYCAACDSKVKSSFVIIKRSRVFHNTCTATVVKSEHSAIQKHWRFAAAVSAAFAPKRPKRDHSIGNNVMEVHSNCLHCFDTVGWASGKAYPA